MEKFYCLPDSGLNKTIVKSSMLQMFIYIFCWVISFGMSIYLFDKIWWIIIMGFIFDVILCAIILAFTILVYTLQTEKYKKAFNAELNKQFDTYKVNTDIIKFTTKKDDEITLYIYSDRILRNGVKKVIDYINPIEQVIYGVSIVNMLKQYELQIYLGNYIEEDGEQKSTAVVIKARKPKQ